MEITNTNKELIEKFLKQKPDEIIYNKYVAISKPFTEEIYTAAIHNLASIAWYEKKSIKGACKHDRKDQLIIYICI